MKILDVHYPNHLLFDAFLREVGDFCAEYEFVDIPFPWFAEVLSVHYRQQSKTALMLLATDPDTHVVGGHLLALVEQPYAPYRKPVAYCYQARFRQNTPENDEAAAYAVQRLEAIRPRESL